MRLLLLITLMVSMAFAPAAAVGSCAAMAGDGHRMAGAAATDHGDMKAGAMTGGDCGDMGAEKSHTPDAGCVAACTLVCPGFYAGPEGVLAQLPGFELAEYPSPAVDPGVALPSRLDPPPPRI